jgi:hypothetical protein
LFDWLGILIYNMWSKVVRDNAFYEKPNLVFVIDGLAMIGLSIAALICYDREGQKPFRPLFIYITCALILHAVGCLICTALFDRYTEPGFKVWNPVYCIVFRIVPLSFYIVEILQVGQPIGRYFSFALLVDPFMNLYGKTGSNRSTVTYLYNQLFFAIYMIMYVWQDRSDVDNGVLDVFSKPLMILVMTGVGVNAAMVIAVPVFLPLQVFWRKDKNPTCRSLLPVLIMIIDIILAIGFYVCLAKYSGGLKDILDNNVPDAEQINNMLAWRAASRRWLIMIVIYLPFRLISLLFITMAVECDVPEREWPYFKAEIGQCSQMWVFNQYIRKSGLQPDE